MLLAPHNVLRLDVDSPNNAFSGSVSQPPQHPTSSAAEIHYPLSELQRNS
jgi:hypothetical protein